MKPSEMTAAIFGIAITKEIPKETKKEMINAILQVELGVTLSEESE